MPRRKSLLFFAFLLAFAGGFYALLYANRAHRRPPPAATVWAAPDKPVRFVSYNVLHNQRGAEQVLAEIRKLDPDVLLLQEVERQDLPLMAERLGLTTHPAVYHASENLAGPRATWGSAILSKWPLYDVESIPNPGGGSFGVWATAVVDGRKFKIANVHLSATWNASPSHLIESGNNRWKELTNLVNAWQAAGAPPIVVGGDFNQIPMGNNHALMTRTWADALKALGKDDATFAAGLLRTRIDYFLISNQFTPLDGAAVPSDASDHKPIWLSAGAARASPATAPR